MLDFFRRLREKILKFMRRIAETNLNKIKREITTISMIKKEEFPIVYDGISNMRNSDDFSKGEMTPSGITIHYSADRNLERVIKTLKEKQLGYHILICRDGSMVQLAYFNQKTWHAGRAEWLGRKPNHEHISVSLLSWGFLKQKNGQYWSWSKRKIPINEVALRPNNINGRNEWWDIATKAQEKALEEFCMWAIRRGISPDAICGHDETAIPRGRKKDPGGVLSMGMVTYRRYLEDKAFDELVSAEKENV